MISLATSPTSLGSAADAAAASTALQQAVSAAGTASSTGTNALTSLASNFNDFLSLLTTQLQNQDPTAPMDANTFTTELVQFTGVQAQVNSNASLNSLIQLTQGGQMLQGAQLVGKQVVVNASEITLQNGTGAIDFTGSAGQSVAVSVVDANGTPIRDANLTAQSGTNQWVWDGHDNAGNTVPAGAYRIAVEAAGANGTAAALPFEVVGTTTGVVSNAGTVQLQLGALTTPLSTLQSVTGG